MVLIVKMALLLIFVELYTVIVKLFLMYKKLALQVNLLKNDDNIEELKDPLLFLLSYR